MPLQAFDKPQAHLNHSALLPGFFGARTPGLPQPYGAPLLQYIIAPHYLSPHAWAPSTAQHDSRVHNLPAAPAAAAGGASRSAPKGDVSDGADVDKGHDADVAEHLRRIEALAEEIARAQVLLSIASL